MTVTLVVTLTVAVTLTTGSNDLSLSFLFCHSINLGSATSIFCWDGPHPVYLHFLESSTCGYGLPFRILAFPARERDSAFGSWGPLGSARIEAPCLRSAIGGARLVHGGSVTRR